MVQFEKILSLLDGMSPRVVTFPTKVKNYFNLTFKYFKTVVYFLSFDLVCLSDCWL